MTLFDLSPLAMRTDATFSEDRTYRYLLSRVWDDTLPMLGFGMLNPSDGNEDKNDPTLTRCISFATDWGYGGFLVGNLFAAVSSNPARLTQMQDPIGPDNDHYLFDVLAALPIVIAWGASVPHYWRHRPAAVVERLRQSGAELYHLGLTKDGHPRHPLYLRGDTQPTRWAA